MLGIKGYILLCNRLKRDERKVGLKIDVRGKRRGMDGAGEERIGWDATCCVQIGWAGAAGMAVFCVPSFLGSRLPARGPPVRGCGSACWIGGQYLPP